MNFDEAIKIVKEELEKVGTLIDANRYDGIIVKRLTESNILDEGRKSHQTHIAITGEQMDIFPYLYADGYKYSNNSALKKYFILQVPVYISETNIKHLGGNRMDFTFTDGMCETTTTIVRSKREKSADQIQVSMLDKDGKAFISFRRLLHENYYFVLLKCKNELKYHIFGVKSDNISLISNLNNKFFNLNTNTVVNSQSFVDNSEENKTEDKDCLEITRSPRVNPVHPLNRIVYGAPGTGKTYSMVEYALATLENISLSDFRKNNTDRKANVAKYKDMVKEERIIFTTFHQNYGYEEFIEGLRPDKDSENLSFKVVDGIFKKIALKAIDDHTNNYVIIIDEINRANISKVFGELITLIEDDKRWGEINEMSVVLPSGNNFAVPNNLYIIGTMNSADKSISLIDTALRRRFHFIEQKPEAWRVTDNVLNSVMTELNEELIEELKSTDLLIGHSYFMNKNEDELCSILNENIIPLLYEYFFDDSNKVRQILDSVIKNTGASIEIEDSNIGRISVITKG
ncbi:MAG: AAA family ATPase [Ruminococcus flavefaciens]|nr:AAA family ATPase [Ruminococcus flavefaciens]